MLAQFFAAFSIICLLINMYIKKRRKKNVFANLSLIPMPGPAVSRERKAGHTQAINPLYRNTELVKVH